MKTSDTIERVKDWVWRWLPALVIMALIFFASSVPKNDVPSFGVLDLLVKKSGHALGYALLGAAYLRGLAARQRPLTWRRAALSLAGAAVYAATDEFHQLFTSGRGAALTDVLLDTGGAVVGIAVWAFIQTRVRPGWLRPPSTPR